MQSKQAQNDGWNCLYFRWACEMCSFDWKWKLRLFLRLRFGNPSVMHGDFFTLSSVHIQLVSWMRFSLINPILRQWFLIWTNIERRAQTGAGFKFPDFVIASRLNMQWPGVFPKRLIRMLHCDSSFNVQCVFDFKIIAIPKVRNVCRWKSYSHSSHQAIAGHRQNGMPMNLQWMKRISANCKCRFLQCQMKKVHHDTWLCAQFALTLTVSQYARNIIEMLIFMRRKISLHRNIVISCTCHQIEARALSRMNSQSQWNGIESISIHFWMEFCAAQWLPWNDYLLLCEV